MENEGKMYVVHLTNNSKYKGKLVEMKDNYVTLSDVSEVSYYKEGNSLKQNYTVQDPYADVKDNTIRFNRYSIVMEYYEK